MSTPIYRPYKPSKSARVNLRIAVALSFALSEAREIGHNVEQAENDLQDFLQSVPGVAHCGTRDQFIARRAACAIGGRPFNG